MTHNVSSPRDLIWVLNQFRAAEIRGAGVILRLGRLADSSALRSNFTRHLRDEGNHAWLWTRTIEHLNGSVIDVDDPYQVRLGAEFGLPKSLNELLCLTLVSERRGVLTYQELLDEPELPIAVRRALRAILRDESWHVEWIEDELRQRASVDPTVSRTLQRAERADELAASTIREEAIVR